MLTIVMNQELPADTLNTAVADSGGATNHASQVHSANNNNNNYGGGVVPSAPHVNRRLAHTLSPDGGDGGRDGGPAVDGRIQYGDMNGNANATLRLARTPPKESALVLALRMSLESFGQVRLGRCARAPTTYLNVTRMTFFLLFL